MPLRRILDDSSDEEINDVIDQLPSDERLKKGLRDAVTKIVRTGELENLTVKRVRLATESALGLEEGFFKSHNKWKSTSEQIIKAEAEASLEKSENQDDITHKSPVPTSKNPMRITDTPVKRGLEQKTSVARNKRRKVSNDDEDDIISSPVEKEAKNDSKPPKAASTATSIQKHETYISESEESPQSPSEKVAADTAEQSESEMSVLLDEAPKTKKRQKEVQSAPKSKGRQTKAVSKPSTDLDPDQTEIKRLQGWLIKCGIRKMWARELAPYETSKAKIKHLKQLLEDAGMKGRYSVEKARQIREERELQADLEAVKEGASRWGTGGVQDESESEEQKPRRRLTKARQSLAFLSDAGEETD